MITKEGITKTLNFMTPGAAVIEPIGHLFFSKTSGAGVLVLLHDPLRHIIKNALKYSFRFRSIDTTN